MATYADNVDVETSLGRSLSTEQAIRAPGLLQRVETRIVRRIPDLAEQVSADPTLGDVVAEIEADVVARFLRNPEGYLQEQDGDYLYIRDRAMPSSRMELTEDEWSRLGVAAGAFTIQPDYAAALEEYPA